MAYKAVPLGARVKPAIKEALEIAAEEDNRTLANLTEKILGDWLKERGYLDPQAHLKRPKKTPPAD